MGNVGTLCRILQNVFRQTVPYSQQLRELTNITMYFLPPNTTSHIQPMDAGFIKNVKYFYRTEIIKRKINSIDCGVEFDINLLQAIIMPDKAWAKVTSNTVRNCFHHVGFTLRTLDTEVAVTSNDPLECFVVESQEYSAVLEIMPKDDYIDCDTFLSVCEHPSSIRLVSNEVETTEEDEESDTVEEVETVEDLQTVSAKEALKAVVKLQAFFFLEGNGLEDIKQLQKLQYQVFKAKENRKIQMTTLDCFSGN